MTIVVLVITARYGNMRRNSAHTTHAGNQDSAMAWSTKCTLPTCYTWFYHVLDVLRDMDVPQ